MAKYIFVSHEGDHSVYDDAPGRNGRCWCDACREYDVWYQLPKGFEESKDFIERLTALAPEKAKRLAREAYPRKAKQ